MAKQAAKSIMMVRPKHFGYDPESAESNAFQIAEGADKTDAIQQLALKEFDNAVALLKSNGVDVRVIEDAEEPVKPNAIFPNNWVSFHEGKVILYPMMAANRRAERRTEVISELDKSSGRFDEIIDLSNYEEQAKYLESTGSLIFDYPNQVAYACRSERTHPEVLKRLCEILDFKPVLFDALDRDGLEIYHTNVMMCLAERYAVICMESIPESQKAEVEEALAQSDHEIIAISFDQMYSFAGNMLEVENESGESILVMSNAAVTSLSKAQRERLSQYSKLISIPIPTIEKYGGGSIRCMMCRLN